jgi:hypothetical protein
MNKVIIPDEKVMITTKDSHLEEVDLKREWEAITDINKIDIAMINGVVFVNIIITVIMITLLIFLLTSDLQDHYS